MTGRDEDNDDTLRDPALSALYKKSRQASASSETDAKILAHAASAAASAAMRRGQRQKTWGQFAAAAAILLVVGSVGTWMIEREDVSVPSLAMSERAEMEAPAEQRENIALNDQPTSEAFQATAPAAAPPEAMREEEMKRDQTAIAMAERAAPAIAEEEKAQVMADRALSDTAAGSAPSSIAASEPAPNAIALATPKLERSKSEPARKAKAATPAAVAESAGIGALKSGEDIGRTDEIAQLSIAAIKRVPAREYDAALPNLALEAWLQSIVPSGMTLAWTAAPVACHESDARATASQQPSPQCVEVAIVGGAKRVAVLHFDVPSAPSPGAQVNRMLVYGEAKAGGGTRPIHTLSELPAVLR